MAVDAIFDGYPGTWELTNLGEVCRRGNGFIQTGPFGSQLHASDYVTVGIPTVMPQNIGDNKIIEDDIARITPQDVQRLKRYKLQVGDIVHSRRGDVTRRALITAHEDGWLCGTGSLMIRVGNANADVRYISYFLGHPRIREWIEQHAVGATMPNLNTSIMAAVPVLLPPAPEQRAIAGILGALDDKIELNRRTNVTLEQMARTAYQRSFVDAGNNPTWRKGCLADIAYFVKGISYRSADLVDESDTALVTLKSMERGGGYREDGLKPYSGPYKPEQRLLPGEVIVAHTDLTQAADVIGRAARIEPNEKYPNLIASLDMTIVRPKDPRYANAYLYGLLSQPAFADYAYGYTNGTTVLHLSSKALPEYELRLPPAEFVERYSELVSPLFQMIDNNNQESRTLAQLRDTLLPKLMSGDVRVGQVGG